MGEKDFSSISASESQFTCLLLVVFFLQYFTCFLALSSSTEKQLTISNKHREWEVYGYLPIRTSTMFSLGVNVWRKKTPSVKSHEVQRNPEYLSLSRALVTNLCFLDMQSSSKVEAQVPDKTGTCTNMVLTGNLSVLPQKKAQL